MSIYRALAVLAAAQLLLAVVTWWPASPSAGRPRPLLDLDRESIDAIEITRKPFEGEEAKGVRLERGPNGWKIASAAGYPAAPDKMEELLDQLLDLRVQAPIATRPSSHNALQVGDEDYGRRVEIEAGDQSVELILGAATSRSVNVRRAGEDDVYRASGASEWSFHDTNASYYDPRYVEADPASLTAVEVENPHGKVRFEKVDDAWTLADLGDGESADAEKITGFLAQVTKVRMSEPVSEQLDPAFGLAPGDAGAASIDWTVEAEDQSVAGGYRVGAEKDGASYVKAVDQPFVVKVRGGSLGRVRDAQRSEFVVRDGKAKG